MQLVAVRQLRSTTLGPGREGITFAHSEHNHPVPGITVTTSASKKVHPKVRNHGEGPY